MTLLRVSFAILMVVGMGLYIAACATGDSEDFYSQNNFYNSQPAMPVRKKANFDFFNRVCEDSGSVNSYGSKEFECHYTDQ